MIWHHRLQHSVVSNITLTSSSQVQRFVKTSRPREVEHKCPFNFTLYWDNQPKRWYFLREGPGDNRHCGHFPTEPEHIQLPTKNIGEENMDLASQLMEANFSIGSVKDFMDNRTGQQLSSNALKHMRHRTRDALLVHSTGVAIFPEAGSGITTTMILRPGSNSHELSNITKATSHLQTKWTNSFDSCRLLQQLKPQHH